MGVLLFCPAVILGEGGRQKNFENRKHMRNHAVLGWDMICQPFLKLSSETSLWLERWVRLGWHEEAKGE